MSSRDAQPYPVLSSSQLEAFPDPVFATDPSGRILHWSARAEAALGWPREFAQGSSCPMLIEGADAQGAAVCQEGCAFAASSAAAGGRAAPGVQSHPDLVINAPHGRTVHATVVAFPAVVDGSAALVHVVRDRGGEGHDLLTGCMTRAPLLARFAEEQRRAEQTSRPLSLALIDVDALGRVNQRQGRAAGDRTLAAVAAVLIAEFGAGTVGRWDDDEFVALIPDTSASEAVSRIEHLLRELRSRLEPGISFSAGVVEVSTGLGFEAARRDADGHLYRAKRRGGHRVI